MTITTTKNRINQSADGVQTVFPYDFIVLDAAHMFPYFDNVVQSAGFTVNGVGDPVGGDVTFDVAPTDGVTVTLQRVVPGTQLVDYLPYDPFPAETHEDALDKLTLITQQISDALARSIKVDVTTPVGVSYTLPVPDAGLLLQWNLAEDGFDNVSVSTLGSFTIVTPFAETLLDDPDADTFWATLMATITKATARAVLDVPGLSDTNIFTDVQTLKGASPIILEGATDDEFETTLAVDDPTADNILTFPDKTGTLATKEEQSKLPTVTGTVAGNDLTAGFLGHTLDFRDATLSDGAITTVQFGDLTLVVPDGATLGAVSAQSTRVALLAINNAGTAEPAIVNLAGGVNLNEEGLVSTTALSAAADANNVIYSAAARASVAYKVVGILEFTQAVAGTYATTPSLKQGAGGGALRNMGSLGFGQSLTSVTGSRAFATTYYNTTGKPIFLMIGTLGVNTNTFTLGISINGEAVAIFGGTSEGGTAHFHGIHGVTIVQAGESYNVTNSQAAGLAYWSERG